MSFWVYMLASRHYGTLYVGVTRDLSRRVWEHKTKAVKGFTARYDVTKLVLYEEYPDPTSAISQEKDIKKWRRDWKIRLLEKSNPNWLDLYETLNR
jgi:putative endonuclease